MVFPFQFFNGAFGYLIRQAWLNVISFHSNELWVEYMSTVIGILIFSTKTIKAFLYSVEKNLKKCGVLLHSAMINQSHCTDVFDKLSF